MSEAALDRLARPLGLVAGALAAATVVVGLWLSPSERAMGELIRILYVHVGAAWVAYLSYAVTAIAAVATLRTRRPGWDRLAAASAEAGLVLTTLTLLTGMLWARAAQGWWWQWSDLRLTLTLVLWFMYAAYIVLRARTDGELRAVLSAVVALLALPAMVLNHFATLLYRGYHPDTIIARPDAPAADGGFLLALVLSLAAYTAVYLWLVALRVGLAAREERLAGARAERAPRR